MRVLVRGRQEDERPGNVKTEPEVAVAPFEDGGGGPQAKE